ncbi:MAG: arginine--tRNA ligase [Dehalococcoidia bacterium]|nr:arginine--tRNA ligase [Dehalococcoidia bacterium]
MELPLIRNDLTALVAEAVHQAQQQGVLPTLAIPDSPVERPQNPEHGDYASTLPLKLARSARMAPMAIAEAIKGRLPDSPAVGSVSVAPPGFINFTLDPGWLSNQVDEIVAHAASFGSVDYGKGERIQVEFVSANPTGPLHVGHGRGAVLGSALASLLAAAGFQVHREYYVNDTGNQIEVFQRSVWARYLQALGEDIAFPEDGYGGSYLVDLAAEVVAQEGDRYRVLGEQEGRPALTRLGMSRMMDTIRADLRDLGVHFDTWFSEASLYQDGAYETVLARLKEGGHLLEKEGAHWFQSTALGEDKDNVLVRSTGMPTYFASDIAYHYDKFERRGFPKGINVWGADHQGHVSRVKAAIAALGIDPARLQVVISQLVTLRRGNDVVRLSKRAGDIIALRDVLDEVGADACRFFFLSRSADSQMDFDLELAKRQSNENPVYYVQYAHARIASVLRNAAERGLEWSSGRSELLQHEAEQALVRKMLALPELIETAAEALAPHLLPHYAMELATTFHNFYEKCRIISEDDGPLTAARLKLAEATRVALARTLTLMGMSAPERM